MWQCQKQIQLNKLIQDKNSSNIILKNILSNLEKLAYLLGYRGKIFFKHYESDYLGKDGINEIIRQLSTQLEDFEKSYKDFKEKYKDYEFPDNLKLEYIIQIVENWKKGIIHKNNYNKYFIIFLNILLNRKDYFLEDKYMKINNKLNNNYCVRDSPYKENYIETMNDNINYCRAFRYKENYEKRNKKINCKEDNFNNFCIKKRGNNFNLNCFEEEFTSYKKNDKQYINNDYSNDIIMTKKSKKCDGIEIKSKCPCKYCKGQGKIIQWKCEKCYEDELLNEEGKIICPNCGEEKYIWEKTFKCGKNCNNYNEICYTGILANLSEMGNINNIPIVFIKKLTKQCMLHQNDFLSE